ncbi:MAG: septum formation inhibitor Maf [Phycisphaerales bacterium]|nr:septum formation inhibitor Maf [Phycisphaerales bacterium]
MKLVLASRSPQRVRLMREAGYEFVTDPADVDETNYPAGLDAVGVAKHLALSKARHVAERHADECVIGADTVVALGERLLGKPDDLAHAREMLGQLSGSTHRVITGIALVAPSAEVVDYAVSTVTMRELTPEELENYLATGDWQGKAGGYGIQDEDPFVTCIDGPMDNVIGLPMTLLATLLTPAGGAM